MIFGHSCSQAQKIRKPQGKMTEASGTLTYSGGQSRPSGRSQKTTQETAGPEREDDGGVRFHRFCCSGSNQKLWLVCSDRLIFPAGVPWAAMNLHGFPNCSSLQQTRKYASGLLERQILSRNTFQGVRSPVPKPSSVPRMTLWILNQALPI